MSAIERIDEGRLLETFFELVRIDSPSREEAGIAAWCASALAESGFAVRFDDSAEITGSDTGNLIAELPGTSGRTLVLCAHMDSVQPCRGIDPVREGGIIRSAGETVLGGDDKAGIAAIIEACRAITAETGPRPTVRVVLTVQEEIGLQGAKALSPADVAGDLCLVLDADGAPGGAIIAAPTHYTFKAEFTGRSSHAGVAPERGVSAIVMASNAVAAMELGRLDEETSANIGSIEGGTATNVVPRLVTMTGECRSRDRVRVEDVRARMDDAMRAAAERAGGTVDVVWALEYEGFKLTEDDPAVRVVVDSCAAAGVTPHLMSTGGGSDANIIAALGVPTVPLSCGMTHVHSVDEELAEADLFALARLTVAIIERMAV